MPQTFRSDKISRTPATTKIHSSKLFMVFRYARHNNSVKNKENNVVITREIDLWCRAAIRHDRWTGTACQIKEKQIRPVIQLGIVAADTAIRVRRVNKPLRVAQ